MKSIEQKLSCIFRTFPKYTAYPYNYFANLRCGSLLKNLFQSNT